MCLSKNVGREIVFVLDGSDAIGEDDFERAKDFIYNLMNNIWGKCFRVSKG